MNNQYTISDFYLFLKLGMWQRGYVANWGTISNKLVCKKTSDNEYAYLGSGSLTNKANMLMGRKPASYYQNQTYAKKQLGLGLYLLDFYLSDRKNGNNENTHILVISVCRYNLENKEYIYYLEVTNTLDSGNFQTAINNREGSRKRKSVFRQKPTRRTFDSKPFNSVRR